MKYKHLVIIGAPKCGTSSMHKILDEHPNIAMARGKEINYFIEPENETAEYEVYLKHFDLDDNVQVIGEASPRYANGVSDLSCFEKMAKTLEDLSLVYMIRDPLDRMESLYFHRLRSGVETTDFLSATRQCSDYFEGSNYPVYLDFIKQQQGISPMLVEFASFTSNPRKQAKKLISYLGEDESILSEYGQDHFNIGDKVGINAKNSPMRYRLLMTSKKAVKSFKHIIPQNYKDSFKAKILGSKATNRATKEFIEAKAKVYALNESFFLELKAKMADKYGVQNDGWYKNL